MNPALFRAGTSDKNIWQSVVEANEYRLPEKFEPNSLCLDIGGNTGAFSHACIQRGAAKVIAFEPDPDNFHLFRKQLKDEIRKGLVEVYPLAVVGGSGFSWRTFSGVVQKDGEINHGGAFVFGEDENDYGLGKYIVGRPFLVPCIGFDDARIPFGMNLHTVKLDCEGSEWGIIHANSRSHGLDKWDNVIGEFHPNGEGNPNAIHLYLTKHRVELYHHQNSDMGLFFARK